MGFFRAVFTGPQKGLKLANAACMMTKESVNTLILKGYQCTTGDTVETLCRAYPLYHICYFDHISPVDESDIRVIAGASMDAVGQWVIGALSENLDSQSATHATAICMEKLEFNLRVWYDLLRKDIQHNSPDSDLLRSSFDLYTTNINGYYRWRFMRTWNSSMEDMLFNVASRHLHDLLR